MMFDELAHIDKDRLVELYVLMRQKERVAKAYDKNAQPKAFNEGDLVWKVILHMDRKDRLLGKWSPNWEGPFKTLQTFSNNVFEIEEFQEIHIGAEE